jgi:hypothetical protein
MFAQNLVLTLDRSSMGLYPLGILDLEFSSVVSHSWLHPQNMHVYQTNKFNRKKNAALLSPSTEL